MIGDARAGVCSFPIRADKQLTQQNVTRDGCHVPWGPATNASTLTHEVGHWLGLAHTFEGGCQGGDGCDDTFPQAEASSADMTTPGDINSCPALTQCNGNGKQNVKNFMDYSECSQEFTKCQNARMEAAWENLRKGRKIGE